MAADGSVIIDVTISKDGIEKGFQMLKNEVGSVGNAARKSGDQLKAAFSGANINKALENAKYKVQQLEDKLNNLSTEFKLAIETDDDKGAARIGAQRERIYDRLAEARRRLSLEVAAAAKKETDAEARELKRKEKLATKPIRKFNSRMSELITGVLFFNLVSSGLSKMTRYFGNALKSSHAFSSSLGKLKGSLLTAFQPIYEAVLPALVSLINILTAATNVVGRFFAAISGKNYKQMQENAEALKNQADGIESVGGAAKKARRDLAGFDEINKLSTSPVDSGGNATADIPADFSDSEAIANLNQILVIVGAIGAALATWKIASLFTDDLSKIAGIAIAVGGAFVYATNWIDAFSNGVDWNNLLGMLVGMGLVVGGLALAFGAVGAAIGLLVASIGLVIVSIKDWVENGDLGLEACVALAAGITGIGVAISLLTGGWIPALIAAVVGFVIACATNGYRIKEILSGVLGWTKGTWLSGWLDIFNGIIDFINGVFTGNWEKAWDGIKEFLRGVVNNMIGAINAWVYGICSGVNAVIKALNRINVSIPSWVPEFGGKSFGFNLSTITPPQIPYLAQGAVIPPNKQFLAVLGDRTHGTNLEAPEGLIRQIIQEEMFDIVGGMMSGFEAVVGQLEILTEVVDTKEIGDDAIGRSVKRYREKMAVVRGGVT